MTQHIPRNVIRKPFHLLFFYLLVLLLPTQIGKHFWADFSLVRGIRIDYLSPTAYLTDILVLATLVVWWWEERGKIKNFKKKRFLLLTSLFLLLVITNTFLSINFLLTSYKWVKVFELILLGWYVSKNIGLLDYWFIGLLGFTVIYSSIIAWAQFLQQKSVGGLLWFLGERTFTVSTPGIAQIAVDGRLVLRPYATFSHPNVLAGYILVVSTLLFVWGLSQKDRRARFLTFVILLFGLLTLIITFSLAVWLLMISLAIAFLVTFGRQIQTIKLRKLIIIMTSICLVTYLGALLIDSKNETIVVRRQLNKLAIRMVSLHPIFGVSLGNFIPRLPDFLETPATMAFFQPAHNIYLLIAAETGLVGLGLFLWFILRAFEIKKSRMRLSIYHLLLVEILLLGLVDHYFVTLQQTQLLFAIIGGMVFGSKSKGTKLKVFT